MSLNYPAKVREIASKAPMFKVETRTSWELMVQMGEDAMFHVHNDASRKIAQDFVKNIHEHLTKSSQSEPDGYTVRFSSVALRYDELMELLYTAYREGQTDGMRRDFNPNFIGENFSA